MKILLKIKNVFGMLLIFSVSYLFCYYINKNIDIRSLYMDDLHNYFYYLRYDFWTYAFGCVEGQTHFRPIFYGLLYIVFNIITKHISRAVLINVFFNAINSTLIYYIVRKLGINKIIAITCSYLFLLSHLSCFLLGQIIGILDSISLFFVFNIFLLCVLYFNTNDEKKIFRYEILIYILFFLLSMTYERYIPLVSVIFILYLIKDIIKNKKLINRISNLLILTFETLIIFLIRFMSLKTIIPIGTGNSDVVENFNIKQVISFIIGQYKFILGMNQGPEHLCGIDFNDVHKNIKIIILITIAIILLVFIYYVVIKIINYIKNYLKKNIDSLIKEFGFDFIVFSFIFINVISSSITIRLEMRWVYVSFMIFVIYFAHIITYILNNNKISKILKVLISILMIVFVLLKTNYELYYRQFYYKIYFCFDLKLTNSLAEQTIYKYGIEEMKNKRVYILYNLYQLSGKIEYYFYEPFTGELNKEDIHMITFLKDGLDINKPEDAEIITNPNNIVLAENYQDFSYYPIN